MKFEKKWSKAILEGKRKQLPREMHEAMETIASSMVSSHGSVEAALKALGYTPMPETPAWRKAPLKSRLSERIRSQPWCSAMLKAPTVDNWDEGFTRENESLRKLEIRPIWTPGFVIDYQDVLFQPRQPEVGRGKASVCLYFGPNGCEMEVIMASPAVDGKPYSWAWRLPLLPHRDGSYRIVEKLPMMPHPADWLEMCLKAEAVRQGFPFADFMTVYASQEHKHFLVVMDQLHQTMQLLQCKNVSLEERFTGTKKRRYARKKHDRQVESYHVLNIPGAGSYWDNQFTAGESGIRQRLHTCRGHFKTYTEDRPHVSGWVGPMWISSHARGNADLGFADKDYNLTEATK